MTLGLLNIQHGALGGRNTMTLIAKPANNIHKTDGCLALLNVAKAFPSVPRTMITDIIREARAPDPIIHMQTDLYSHTPAALHLHSRDLPMHPRRGMKEGCPLSPTLFLLCYDAGGGREKIHPSRQNFSPEGGDKCCG